MRIHKQSKQSIDLNRNRLIDLIAAEDVKIKNNYDKLRNLEEDIRVYSDILRPEELNKKRSMVNFYTDEVEICIERKCELLEQLDKYEYAMND
jgi:hypothetical protein